MKNQTIKAVGYVRVSDDSQVDGHSLNAQRREITRHCQSQGYHLIKIYSDEGVSAYTDRIEKRPELTRLLEDARSRLFDIVIVHTLDRWARNTGVQRQALQLLGQCDIGFSSVTENFDFTTPMGKMMLTTMGAMSEFFSDQLGVHVRKAQRQRAELGLPLGDVPFGYVRNEDPRQAAETVPTEAQAVRQAFDMRAQGESHGAIAALLNNQGFQTRTGRRFTEYSIRDMLATRFYIGVIRYQGQEYPGQHRAIISEDLYQLVEQRRARHGRKNIRGGITGALQGILSCGHCGNAVHSERNHQGDPRYRERHGWPCFTNGASVVAHRIDPQIGQIIAGIRLPKEWREKILRTAITGSDVDVSVLKQQRQRIARAYGDGAYADEDYERRLDEIDAKILSATPASLPSIEEAAELIDDLPLLWRDARPEERRKLVAPLVDQVYVDLRSRKIAALRPKPGFKELLAHATRRLESVPCILLSPGEVREMQNVGMVETGGG
jgi:site-specific DNA recombinase